MASWDLPASPSSVTPTQLRGGGGGLAPVPPRGETPVPVGPPRGSLRPRAHLCPAVASFVSLFPQSARERSQVLIAQRGRVSCTWSRTGRGL